MVTARAISSPFLMKESPSFLSLPLANGGELCDRVFFIVCQVIVLCVADKDISTCLYLKEDFLGSKAASSHSRGSASWRTSSTLRSQRLDADRTRKREARWRRQRARQVEVLNGLCFLQLFIVEQKLTDAKILFTSSFSGGFTSCPLAIEKTLQLWGPFHSNPIRSYRRCSCIFFGFS